MKKILLILSLVLIHFFVKAQSLDFQWAQILSNQDEVNSRALTYDNEGNTILTSAFEESLSFTFDNNEINLTTQSFAEDNLIAKYDNQGNMIWYKQFEARNFDYIRFYSIITNHENEIFALGMVDGEADIDPGVNETMVVGDQRDMILVKLSINGDYQWHKKIGAEGYETGFDISLDNDENILITGFYGKTVDFDPGPDITERTAIEDDPFVLKLDKDGNFLWVYTPQCEGLYDGGNQITTSENGDVFVVGNIGGSCTFLKNEEEVSINAEGDDIFFMRLRKDGILKWVHALGGSNTDYGQSINIDNESNVYIGGYYYGDLDADPSDNELILPGVNRKSIVAKYDQSGEIIWAKEFGGWGVQEIKIDNQGYIYVAGYYSYEEDLEPGDGVTQYSSFDDSDDIFIQKWDQNGELVWIDFISGESGEYISNLKVHPDQSISIAGRFLGTLTLDSKNPNDVIVGGDDFDAFMVHYQQPLISKNNNLKLGFELALHPNPIVNEYTINLKDVYKTLTMTIVSSKGQVIENSTFKNISELTRSFEAPPGIYYLQLKTDVSQSVIKFVKL